MKIKRKIKFLVCFDLVLLLSMTAWLFAFKPLSSADHDKAFAEEMNVETTSYTKTFTISAYYSPLPCQNRYATGSYEADIRLNGRGVRGADGSPVYPGMVAAPKSYDFGTKMEIPGIGIVAVHDRGGAIVTGNGVNSYDRLDIWMGYGDKGLTRALNWGKRTMDVVIYGVNDGIAEQVVLGDYDASEAEPTCSTGSEIVADEPVETQVETPVETVVEAPVVPEAIPEIVVEKTEAPVVTESKISANETKVVLGNPDAALNQDLKLGDSGAEVTALQGKLSALNLFKAEVTGYYGDVTKHAVFKFQQSQALVPDASSPFAGIFGPKTRDRLNEITASKNYNRAMVANATQEYNQVYVAKVDAVVTRKKLLTSELQYGMTGPEVAALQKFLKDMGYFDGALITEYYGPVTQKAVLRFQKAHNLVSSEGDTGAGRVGPETLETINTLVS